ncbi:MAG: hypothetical protein H6739_40720 [Alphaproteobacteria bacterium]|nr:hypothetical protein [Alphaproteobacteria bacterium]
MRASLLALAALSFMGCKEPIEAPDDLNELSAFIFVEWDNEDPEALVAGVTGVEAWAADQPADSSTWGDRFYSIDALTQAQVDGEALVTHDLDPADAPGVGLLYVSAFPPSTHATIFGETDQTPFEPASPDFYARTITDGDAGAFAAGTETTLASHNEINRKNFLFNLDYELEKVWRWVELEDGRKAIVSRSWSEESGPPNDDKQLLQAYAIEMWIEQSGGALRWLITWQDAELGLDQDAIESLVGGSMNDTFEAQEEHFEG